VKYAFMEQHKKSYTLLEMSDVLEASLSGYRAWKRGGTENRKHLSDEQTLVLIETVHAETKGAYGSPRIHRELKNRGFRIGKTRVEKMMSQYGIRARHKRRYKATTDSKHNLPIAKNLLERDFSPRLPNQVWTADITYLWTNEGWLYLAIVMDLFNREVVGWSMLPTMKADIVANALEMAWKHRKPPKGLIHHSDRGSQYASHLFQEKLKSYGMVCSMSRKGNCWDNAPTESWFHSFKNERIHGLRFDSREEMKAECFAYIEVFYNRKRLHSTLGFLSPKDFLEEWRQTQNQQKQVA